MSERSEVSKKSGIADVSNPAKKKLVIKPVSRQSSMVRIVYEGGGEAPAALAGAWTSSVMAQRAILNYEKTNKA